MTADSWDDFAADWDNEPDVRKYADKAFESWQRKAAPLISSMAETRVLDFGCGTGLLTEKLAPLCQHVVAVDTSVEKIRLANSGSLLPRPFAVSCQILKRHSATSLLP